MNKELHPYHKFSLPVNNMRSPLLYYYVTLIGDKSLPTIQVYFLDKKWYWHFGDRPLDDWFEASHCLDDCNTEFKDTLNVEIKKWQFRQELAEVLK